MYNSTAVAHVNNKGGTRSLQLVDLTLELWEWCLQKSILITAQHLPGKRNNVADRKSRVLRLQRMANRPTSDSALPKKMQCRSLCVTSNGSLPSLCQLETMPVCYLHRCNDPRLVPSKRLCLSTIQSDRTSTEESISGQSRSGACGPSVAGTTLVASPPERLDPEPCHDPKPQTPAEESCIPSEDAPNVPQASFSRLSLIREQHQTEGFSEDITRILQSATQTPTNNNIIIITLFKLLKMYHIRHTSHPWDYGIAGVLNRKLIQFVPP